MDDQIEKLSELLLQVPVAPTTTVTDRIRRRVRLYCGLARKKVPLRVGETWSAAYAEAVARAALEWQPEVVQFEFDVMAQYLPALEGCSASRVVVVHEPGVDAARERRAGAPSAVRRADFVAWQRFTAKILAHVDAAIVFSEQDRCTLQPYAGQTPIEIIPPGVELKPAPLTPVDKMSIIFIGNFIHPPNIDAAHALLTRIFPRVREHVADATLHVIGASPPVELMTHRSEGVIVTGQVPSIDPFLERAAVVAAPIRQGGGVRIKVLEALAAGKAIVATSRALNGLDESVYNVVRVADDEIAFADAIIQLLRDTARRNDLAERARRWAEAHLNWDERVEAYERLYEQLLTKPATPL